MWERFDEVKEVFECFSKYFSTRKCWKEASHSRFRESFPISQLLHVPPRPSPCRAIFSRANFFHSPKAAFWAFRVKLIILSLFLWLLVVFCALRSLKFLYFLHLLFIYTHSRFGATRSLPAFLLSSFFRRGREIFRNMKFMQKHCSPSRNVFRRRHIRMGKAD